MGLTTLVVADDHPVVREGLKTLMKVQPGFHVVGEAADGHQAVRLVEELQPQVLIVDMRMPGLTGAEVARRVSRHSPSTRVVILSMHTTEGYVLEALRAGALGYVVKDASNDNLVCAVQEAIQGRRYLSPPLSERALETYRQQAEDKDGDPYSSLTRREREVLQLAAEGWNNPAIAKRLHISSRTVEDHRANLRRKLDLQTQTDIVLYALRKGLLPQK